MSTARPEGDPAERDDHDRDAGRGEDADPSYPTHDRRRMVDLTRVEAGEPERRAPFRRFAEGETDS